MLAHVIDRVNRIGIGVHALSIEHERARIPAVPQRERDVDELLGPRVSLLARGDLVESVIAGLGVEHRGDYVPSGSSATDVIERGEQPGGVKRRVERGGHRGDQPDVGGRSCHGRQRRDRFEEPGSGTGRIAHRVPVREEHRIELAPLGGTRELGVIADVAEVLDAGARVTPGGTVVSAAEQKSVEMQHDLVLDQAAVDDEVLSGHRSRPG